MSDPLKASMDPPRTVTPPPRLIPSDLRISSPSALLKIHLFALVLCAFSWGLLSPSTALIFNGCVVGITYFWLAIAESRRGPLWLTPLSIFFFFYGIEMGPATVYIGYVLRADPWLPFARWLIPVSNVAAGYLISLTGMLAMHAGLELKCPPARRSIRPEREVGKLPLSSLGILWLLGVIATYRPLRVLPFGMFGITLAYGGLAALLPMAFASSRQLGISRQAHAILFALGTCGLTAAAAAGANSKMAIVLCFLPLAALLVRTRRYRKSIPFALTAALLLYLGLIAPAINESRNIPMLRGMTTWDRVVQSAEEHSILAHSESAWDLLSEQYGNLMMRMFEPPSATGFIFGEVARSGLQMGHTMHDLEYAFIPRIIWPQKPMVSRSAWFTTYVGMAARPQEATSSTGMTAFGEWYWNFGIFGEVAGMFLIGVLISGLWRLVGSYPIFEPIKMLLYAAILVDSVLLPEASSVLVTMVALYLLFGGYIFFRRIVDLRAIRLRIGYQPRS